MCCLWKFILAFRIVDWRKKSVRVCVPLIQPRLHPRSGAWLALRSRPLWRSCRCGTDAVSICFSLSTSRSCCSQQRSPGRRHDHCPQSIDVQNPWNIRALERPEPTTLEDCLCLIVKRERAAGKVWRWKRKVCGFSRALK